MAKRRFKFSIFLILSLVLSVSLVIGIKKFTQKPEFDMSDFKIKVEKLLKEGKTKQAQKLLEEAATLGNTEAQHNLAMMVLAQGNIEQAEKLLIKAAHKGNLQAQTQLGMLYIPLQKKILKTLNIGI